MDKVVTAKEDLASRRRYAALQRESFDGGHLASVRLQQLWFTRCTFRRADLRQATLDGCRFKLCDLRGANQPRLPARGLPGGLRSVPHSWRSRRWPIQRAWIPSASKTARIRRSFVTPGR
ncbi:pentapeptide repeat-containing protein [Streptomyces sp. NBC_01724]|uniref:pentapeptide repeat-containing protein n=1 Tax=unclassified Streptomyces TaxID=2593676 RepID=UPI002E2F76C2|nr:pentapeptide repeat-containing protein [Streptomyces sp. NBC_01724]WTE57382.1 pentapeptide repeat-containing protein [Streptomyces sp. NBC_01617]WTE64746.1 pentapeptide repeat-containing protein [Streptomyces sp. NBC_01617]